VKQPRSGLAWPEEGGGCSPFPAWQDKYVAPSAFSFSKLDVKEGLLVEEDDDDDDDATTPRHTRLSHCS